MDRINPFIEVKPKTAKRQRREESPEKPGVSDLDYFLWQWELHQAEAYYGVYRVDWKNHPALYVETKALYPGAGCIHFFNNGYGYGYKHQDVGNVRGSWIKPDFTTPVKGYPGTWFDALRKVVMAGPVELLLDGPDYDPGASYEDSRDSLNGFETVLRNGGYLNRV